MGPLEPWLQPGAVRKVLHSTVRSRGIVVYRMAKFTSAPRARARVLQGKRFVRYQLSATGNAARALLLSDAKRTSRSE